MGWIESLDEARASGLAGAVLTFNTGDRVFCEREGGVQLASLKYFLAAKYAAEGIRVGYYSLASRFTELSPQEHRGAAPSPFGQITAADNALFVLRDLDPILKDPDSHSVVVIDYAEHLASAQLSGGAPVEQSALIEKLHDWSLDDDIKQSGNFIILISRENALHHLVRHESGYRMIAIDLPDATTRRAFTAYLLRIRAEGKLQHRLGDLGADLPVEDFARITSGLRLSDIEELLCHAGGLKRPITRDGVRVRKRQTIDQLCHGLVEVIEPTEGFESVAGCRAAKEYFNAIKPLWLSGHGSLPQGILLAGTPGSGKSFLIKALAMELGVPCLVMRGVREQWVGASERNMDRVLQVADSLAPCIFWTDELDQQLGGERSSGPSGDSGVNGRLLGRILEFFGDSRIRGRILWLATTNRPDLLDAAIKDRFSIKIPFLHPSRSERAALLPVLAAQVGRAVEAGVDCTALAARAELRMLSVRALQEIVVWAGMLADRRRGNGGSPLGQSDLDGAIQDYKPSVDPLEQELIALLAVQMTSFQSLLPWIGLGGFQAGAAEWPDYLNDLVDAGSGRVDLDKLARRIGELHRGRHARRALG